MKIEEMQFVGAQEGIDGDFVADCPLCGEPAIFNLDGRKLAGCKHAARIAFVSSGPSVTFAH